MDITGGKKVRRFPKTEWGISEEQFQEAASIGVNRRRVLVRVRDYGWDIERAVKTPVGKRFGRS